MANRLVQLHLGLDPDRYLGVGRKQIDRERMVKFAFESRSSETPMCASARAASSASPAILLAP